MKAFEYAAPKTLKEAAACSAARGAKPKSSPAAPTSSPRFKQGLTAPARREPAQHQELRGIDDGRQACASVP